MTRYIATYGARQTVIYAPNEAEAQAKGAAYFHLDDGQAYLVNVHLDKRN